MAGPHDGREKKEQRDGDDGSIGSVGVSPSFDNGEDAAMDFDFWSQVWIWAVCCGVRVRGATWAWIYYSRRLVGDGSRGEWDACGWSCWPASSDGRRRRTSWLGMAERGDGLLQASDGRTADDGFGLLPALEELLAQRGGGWRRSSPAGSGCSWSDGAAGLGGRGGRR
ncbi:hypothetical protein ACLOJK_036548 [Asimina triloba]